MDGDAQTLADRRVRTAYALLNPPWIKFIQGKTIGSIAIVIYMVTMLDFHPQSGEHAS